MQLAPHLARTLRAVCGLEPELTIRGEQAFTFSFDTVELEAAAKLVEYFSTYHVRVEHDDECGTFVYVDVIGDIA